MFIADGHCDTLTEAVEKNTSLVENTLHWDISRASLYDGFIQVLAIFHDREKMKPSVSRVEYYAKKAEAVANQAANFVLAKDAGHIKKAIDERKVCGILAVEGGDCLDGKTENLRKLYDIGIRIMTLTWNNANELGDGCGQTLNGGLTPFGSEIVGLMQDIGMIVDVSHADEKTFWDCIEECRKPVIASHSNARAVHDHRRNLYDDQILAIAKTNGVIGVNFYTEFVGPPKKNDVNGLIRHIEHICAVAGEDTAALGADFDGVESLPEQIRGVHDLDVLFNSLARLNYSDSIIRKIAGENLLRVYTDVL
ncbi:MAG TPA: M19 family membrane dipeptidase [Ruminiclostridium sp.]|jgi:membrane dipeptidase|nr:M19 family membrane dipeptidase [Ruminiclostridium sp.]